MPPLKAVDRLEKLCSWKIANHLFVVLSSWYKGQTGGRCPSGWPNENCFGNGLVQGTNGFGDVKNGAEEGHSWHLSDSGPATGSPVPLEHQTVGTISRWLASGVRDFLACHLAPRFREAILTTFINVVAGRMEIPRPKDKLRVYEEDLDFLNALGFLLNVCLKCLLTKGVTSLDFSQVSHLLKRWKLLCWGGQTSCRSGQERESPYFDVFGYALDSGVSGLGSLRYVKLPHFVHDGFVQKVAYLCPKLEVLILRCSADCADPKGNVPAVTNVGVLCGHWDVRPDGRAGPVPGCRNLVTLALPEGVETQDVTRDAVEMLSFMPNLQHLVGAPMIYVTEEFEETFETLPAPSRLTNFHHGAYGRSNWPSFVYEESLKEPDPEYLSRVFSQVREVGIYAPTEVTEKVLRSFSRAQDVTIFTDDFEVHGRYLRNLTSLDINVGYQEEWPILVSLGRTCPRLEQLTLRSFSLQMGSLGEGLRFPCLSTLKFHGQNVLQGDALLAFVRGCPLLTTFYLSMITDEDGDSQLEDDVLARALPLLPNVQKFVYKVQSALRTVDGVPSSLTIKSCDALIAACPQLTYIGQLETWKVTRSEIVALQDKVRKRNWELEIV